VRFVRPLGLEVRSLRRGWKRMGQESLDAPSSFLSRDHLF